MTDLLLLLSYFQDALIILSILILLGIFVSLVGAFLGFSDSQEDHWEDEQ